MKLNLSLSMRVVLLTTLLLALPAHAQSLKDAYIDTKKSAFKKEFKHLAMMPVVAVPSISMPEALRQMVSDEVLKKLTKSKYNILPPEKVKVIQDQFSGLYSADALKKNTELIRDHTVRELFFQHPVNGLIVVEVFAVAAPFAKDKAEWNGTSQKIKHKGDGFLNSIMGKDYAGHIGASSIRIVISDRQGKPVYNWSGGIELLMRRNGQKLEMLPEESIWQNEKRVIKAVKFALKPI